MTKKLKESYIRTLHFDLQDTVDCYKICTFFTFIKNSYLKDAPEMVNLKQRLSEGDISMILR